MFLIPQPKDFWQLAVCIGGIALYVYVMRYGVYNQLDVPLWVIAVPMIVVGLYFFLKYEGVKISFKKKTYGKRGV